MLGLRKVTYKDASGPLSRNIQLVMVGVRAFRCKDLDTGQSHLPATSPMRLR